MATLLLLRHAKSAWGQPELQDHDRPLDERGERAALVMGEYIRQRRREPDMVLCSSARRARQTWGRVQDRLTTEPQVAVEPGLYLCGWPALLERLQRLDRSVSRAMLVAHNPDLQDLALSLVAEGPADDLAALSRKFPTAGLAVLTYDGTDWTRLERGSARLERFVAPKQLV